MTDDVGAIWLKLPAAAFLVLQNQDDSRIGFTGRRYI